MPLARKNIETLGRAEDIRFILESSVYTKSSNLKLNFILSVDRNLLTAPFTILEPTSMVFRNAVPRILKLKS